MIIIFSWAKCILQVMIQTLDTLELKKIKVLIMFVVGNQMEYIVLNLYQYILLSYIA